MSENKPWHVAINGVEQDETFDGIVDGIDAEQRANDYAASRRGSRADTKAPDIAKKIAVYQKGTRRHEKAVAAGGAPKPGAAPTETPDTDSKEPKQAEAPPAGRAPKAPPAGRAPKAPPAK